MRIDGLTPVTVATVAKVFKTGYKRKSLENRTAVDRALERMAQDLSHPSLRARPMTGRPAVWEARANDAVRLTFDFVDPTTIRLRKCCTHEIYRRP
jgi:hypothetical protein